MELSRLKHKLREACLAEIDDRISSLKMVMEEAQQSANDYGQPKDRYDSYRTQLLRKRDMFGQQLSKIMEQRNLLERLNPDKSSSIAEFGALVITDKQRIFISVGIGRLEFEGEEYFVISPVVPFCKAMEGKKKGDAFEFRGQPYTIKDIA